MVDANEAWTPKEAVRNLTLMQRAGHDIYWIEDPILRDDFTGLKLIQDQCGPTLVNAGEYLDVSGKRKLLEARVCDLLNVHGQVTDVMRIGWLAAEMGAKISMGNTFLEVGVNMALALPGVDWLEYSFQNFEHLVEQPYEIRDGASSVPKRRATASSSASSRAAPGIVPKCCRVANQTTCRRNCGCARRAPERGS
jgi:L-alanine-DL-glutamate epimerase-like enolase superfamily enzyme